MEHTPAADIKWVNAGDEHFTGTVFFGPLSAGPDRSLNALGVLFEPEARTDWHSHPDGQVLYIVAGVGKVQKDDGETVRLSGGDVVYAAAGEKHWHGASETSFLMHLSLTTGRATEWLPEKVSEQDYRRG
ncbi:MAG: cupin domain-containing protein [Acidimicrobiia bacterium]|nr:cupin domain-containing protein [Acidimicrobiia bacterium]MDH5615520.1 cupin domain-containing protein [Acidimicrobiia bacterium]